MHLMTDELDKEESELSVLWLGGSDALLKVIEVSDTFSFSKVVKVVFFLWSRGEL